MKRIGLLGGMSWESSIEYERLINRAVRERLGGVHSADLIVRSFDFAVVERLQAAGDWDGAGDLLAAAATDLERAGAELLVLCTNTMHQVAGRPENRPWGLGAVSATGDASRAETRRSAAPDADGLSGGGAGGPGGRPCRRRGGG